MEISQPQPVTAVSRPAASHHWSASGSWHRTWWYILLLQRSVTVSNTVDTELIAYFADCKNYPQNSGLKFWVTNANKYPLLAPLAQDLLSAPASSGGSRISERGAKDEAPQAPSSSRRRREDRGAEGAEGVGVGRGCPPPHWRRGLGRGLFWGGPSPENVFIFLSEK